ncbi:MAG: hypothetical protein GW778_01975 [Alphaproteobacteria bacterium]|nr:hypothetical protein [Alphaproteobacteria bacterium]
MTKKYLLGALLALAIIPNAANAQGLFDRINGVVNKVDETLTTSERAQNSIDRIMDKVPESQKEEPATQPQEQIQPKIHVQPTQASAVTTMTAEQEEAILQQAREIEERKILEAAERIKKQRAAMPANN